MGLTDSAMEGFMLRLMRAGNYDEARDVYSEALKSLGIDDSPSCLAPVGVNSLSGPADSESTVPLEDRDIEFFSEVYRAYIRRFPECDDLSDGEQQGDSIPLLLPNEIETIYWLAQGCSLKEIASEKLHRSLDQVNNYVKDAKRKLNARNRDQLVANALARGLI